MVDVFAERLYSGNPLAVIVYSEPLPDETMQRIAAEMNFSETTFVNERPADDGSYTVRVFTPVREIAFTGHPILGTAWVVRHHLAHKPDTQVSLNLQIGQVVVTFEQSAGREIAWFRAPTMSLSKGPDLASLATALGLSTDDIVTTSPIQVISASTSAIIVPLTGLEALSRGRLDLDRFARLQAAGFPPLVYLFCEETRHPENDLSARFFFEAQEVREDPATGNGAAFLGAYMLEHQVHGTSELDLRIEQGYEIQRPSLIRLRAQLQDNDYEVTIGGEVLPTAQGEML
jgi:trans-2,3-dihydro-3-hydroxyanthranilate isomerase